jgi:KipI family sensor histidine kinase inhibitor
MDAIAQEPRFLPSGDTALVVEFGDRIDRRLSAAVTGLADRIRVADLGGVTETVPTYRSLLVHYNPLETSAERLTGQISGLISRLIEGRAAEQSSGRLWRIPACHDPAFAPDLAEVAAKADLTPDEAIALHQAERYHVYMVGFVPGFPYLGDLPEALQLPRRENPRVKVPAGSVAIAASMTAVYTAESPGGWHLIGRTPAPLFDLRAEPPALLRPGDGVLFEPISKAEFERIARAMANDDYSLEPEALA